MTAKDVITPLKVKEKSVSRRSVTAGMPLVDVLPRLLDAPGRCLDVTDSDGEVIGVIDEISMLEGLGRMIAPRDDSSVITIDCKPSEYSASLLAHAVEDSDAHLVDLWSTPGEDGDIRVTLRVRNLDPTSTVHNLERYGFRVSEAVGAADTEPLFSAESLLALQTLLNV